MKAATRSAPSGHAAVSQAEYETLAEFRHQLAAFLHRRREAATAAGLEAQQYELLLAIKGAQHSQPNIKQIAEQLLLQHHSAVELTTRLEKRGLVQRTRSPQDRRSVLLSVTKEGDRILEKVVQYSLSQLQVEAPQMLKILGRLVKRPRRK